MEVVEQDAEGFLREQASSKIIELSPAGSRRFLVRAGSREGIVRQTKKTITVGGNWHQTPAELEFGVRRAWRNARISLPSLLLDIALCHCAGR